MRVPLFTLLSLLISAYSLSATAILVPTDQPTIQAGILAASDGDTEPVRPGASVENIDYSGLPTDVGTGFSGRHNPVLLANSGPGVPQPRFPINDATVGLAELELIADTSTNSDGVTVQYFFEIAEDTTDDSPIGSSEGWYNPISKDVRSRVLTHLKVPRWYFWRVRAWSSYEYSDWSGWMRFGTRASYARLLVPQTYPTIQSAINSATPGDTIVLGPGTYTGEGNRDLSFGSKGGITIMGNSGAQLTTLDAQGSAASPHRLVSLTSLAENDLTFRDLTFTNGYEPTGGAVKSLAPISFIGCVFRNNHATNCGVFDAPQVMLTDCLIENNTAQANGAVFYNCDSCAASSCQFVNNWAWYGGIMAGEGKYVFSQCRIENNFGHKGAVASGIGMSIVFSHCLILGNQGIITDLAGGEVTMNYCTVVNNSAHVCLMNQSGVVNLNDCIVAFNGGITFECVGVFDDTPFKTIANARNLCLYGNGYSYPGCITADSDTSNVFSQNPMFCDQSNDFRLQSGSPCAAASSSGGPIGYGAVGCQTTDVGDNNPPLATSFELSQNYPNPFNPTTAINYSLARASDVHLTVYNILGQVIDELVNKRQPAGEYSITWDGTARDGKPVASGIYFYHLNAGEFTASKKMLLLR